MFKGRTMTRSPHFHFGTFARFAPLLSPSLVGIRGGRACQVNDKEARRQNLKAITGAFMALLFKRKPSMR